MQTRFQFFKNSRTWNQWLKMPVLVKDCTESTHLAITAWDLNPLPKSRSLDHHVPFGGTTISLFDDDGKLRTGRQKCRIYRNRVADGELPTRTPHISRPKRRRRNAETEPRFPEEEELERLEGLLKKQEMGEIQAVEWLDKLVYKKVSELERQVEDAARKRAALRKAAKMKAKREAEERLKRGDVDEPQNSDDEFDSEDELNDEERFTLYIEFPRWDFPVVFEDHRYDPPKMIRDFQNTMSPSGSNPKPSPEVKYGPGIANGNTVVDDEDYPVIRIFDPEQFQKENPCETKHRRLVRSERNMQPDTDMKPNAKLRDELNEILFYGPTQDLTAQEKDVLWTFRRHLSRDKRALTKVVKATDWNSPKEARAMTDLIPRWAEIDVDAALELLGPTFEDPAVRAYAVDRLRKADDDELQLYLLQLVQALKFESQNLQDEELPESSLASFLVDRAASNFNLGNFLHWFLMVECDDRGPDTNAANRKIFAKVEYHFMRELERRDPSHHEKTLLLKQAEIITVLSSIGKDIRFSRENRGTKIERLKKFLGDPKNELSEFKVPFPLPLDPTIMVHGINADDASVFKSSLSPLLLNFKVQPSTSSSFSPSQTRYPIIFKTGDDLRQDQLVIQIITLINSLLLKENLDLKLTPYKILATSPLAGAVQYIHPSIALSAISSSKQHRGSVLSYFRSHNPDPNGPLGVRRDVIDTYIKSCAGYCVITYILGVGDRHLDNLLLQPSGHFFHIDFGFILGRDPKPFAPLIKLCKEMIEGLGGTNSHEYTMFKSYCFTAYTTLRKSSSLVLNLFSLMVESSVQDIRLIEEQIGLGGGAVAKVRERFHLEMTEEDAVKQLDQVLGDSVNAVFGAVIDRLHQLVQDWRT